MSSALPTKYRDISRKGGVRVLAASGPSGGHIFPALSFLSELKEKHPNIETLLILPQARAIGKEEEFPCKLKYVSISGLKFKFNFKNILAGFNFLKGSLQSLFILIDFRPDVVVGFGSLSCVPVIIFAWLLRINTLIHEQNLIPGRANMFLAMFADRIAISFPKTREYLRRYGKKIAYTGNPIRPELIRLDKLEALNFFGLSCDKFTILVMGGSQGSHRINIEFQKSVSGISRELSFQIIHLSGSRDYSFLKPKYNGLNMQVRLFDFLKPMHYAYSAADLVISRAGATTISEIIFFALPAILIPYPYANEHQSANARILKENGCAVIIADEEVGSGSLKSSIEYFMSHPDKMKNMRLSYRNFIIPDSSQELAREVIRLAS